MNNQPQGYDQTAISGHAANLMNLGEAMLGSLREQSIRMTTPLAGGVGRSKQQMCGALSAGVLVIGGIWGRTDVRVSDDQALSLAERYRSEFVKRFGSAQCAPLREWVKGPTGYGSCAILVAQAAGLLLQLIQEAGPPSSPAG
jgi:C_GCAxxG_C_C family probable redox protein